MHTDSAEPTTVALDAEALALCVMARISTDPKVTRIPGARDIVNQGIRKGDRFYEVSLLPDRDGVRLHITENYRSPLQVHGPTYDLTWEQLDQIKWSPNACQ